MHVCKVNYTGTVPRVEVEQKDKETKLKCVAKIFNARYCIKMLFEVLIILSMERCTPPGHCQCVAARRPYYVDAHLQRQSSQKVSRNTFAMFVLTLLFIFIGNSFLVASTVAFAPSPSLIKTRRSSRASRRARLSRFNMGFGLGDDEPKTLTRESEPDEFFATNLDKVSDKEKLPIAIAGFVFVSLPFIAGLIALYAAK